MVFPSWKETKKSFHHKILAFIIFLMKSINIVLYIQWISLPLPLGVLMIPPHPLISLLSFHNLLCPLSLHKLPLPPLLLPKLPLPLPLPKLPHSPLPLSKFPLLPNPISSYLKLQLQNLLKRVEG
jgi:hypothetical protein